MSTKGYKCPSCGGNLVFSSDTQKLRCPSCENEIDMETIQQYAEIVESVEEQADTFEWEEKTQGSQGEWALKEKDGRKFYTCPSCGGDVDADETTAATKCPYCDSPVILPGQVSGEFQPDLIIPFQLNKDDVKTVLKEHCKGKKLLPRGFQSEHNIKKITGIYVPFWLFSCRAKGSIIYDAEKIKQWRDDYNEFTQKDLYLVTREGDIFFEHVPVDGSAEMDDAYMEAIEPFGLEKAVPFEEGYLSGYKAFKYDVPKEECRRRAEDRIRNSFEDIINQSIDRKEYSTIKQKSCRLVCKNGKVKYSLMPVWLLDVKYKDRTYRFAVNGQTGKLSGDLPVDRGLYWKYALSVFAGSSVIIYLLMILLLL